MFGFFAGRGFSWRLMKLFGGGRFLKEIELSDEQLEKVAELKEESFGKFAHARIDGMQLHQKLFKELGKENIDKEKVKALAKEIKEQKSAVTDLMVDNMLAFAEILTPDQRKKIKMKGLRHLLGGEGRGHCHSEQEEHGHGQPCSHSHGSEEDENLPPPPPPRRGGPGFGRRHHE